jgi:hypothetical protein
VGLIASFSNLQAIYLTDPKVISRSFLKACRLTYLIKKNCVSGKPDMAVGHCYHGMARPHDADRGRASNMEGSSARCCKCNIWRVAVPDTVITVTCALYDGWSNHPEYVKQFTEI